MVVGPALLYGAKCWPVKKTQVQRVMVAKMRMIRWMCKFTRLDKIRNEVIREKVAVPPTEEKLRRLDLDGLAVLKGEAKMNQHGHVRRLILYIVEEGEGDRK